MVPRLLLILILCLPLTSCSILSFLGDAVVFTGKAATAAVKTTGAVVVTTGRITGKVGKATVGFFRGSVKVPLHREGNSLLVDVELNGELDTRLVLDTGATSVQIAPALARKLGLDLSGSERVQCTLADNRTVWARAITLDEVQVGRARVKDVSALVIETDPSDDGGLLGMSFLENFVFQIDAENSQLILDRK